MSKLLIILTAPLLVVLYYYDWLMWYLILSLAYTLYDVRGQMWEEVAAELLIFPAVPVLEVGDLIANFIAYWHLRYTIWAVRRKLSKNGKEVFDQIRRRWKN